MARFHIIMGHSLEKDRSMPVHNYVMYTLLKMGCSVACLKMTPQGCKLVAMDTFDLFVLKVKFSRFPQTL